MRYNPGAAFLGLAALAASVAALNPFAQTQRPFLGASAVEEVLDRHMNPYETFVDHCEPSIPTISQLVREKCQN